MVRRPRGRDGKPLVIETKGPKSSVDLRIATYNIHRCRGIDGRTRPERIAAVLRSIDADVVALQEVVGARHDQH
jgi:endonuclease/exonuclease/phosphatase family metal-dependent hydrolase